MKKEPVYSETDAQARARAEKIVAVLEETYPDAVCALRYEGDPFRLLMMARLSAQCTDARVNLVSEELFRRWPDVWTMAGADYEELCEVVKPCGLYRTKAQSMIDASRMLCENFGGELPRDMDALLALPGVGRKIANLLRGDIFGLPAIVADTHCIRLAGRLGFCPAGERDPYRVELRLCAVVAPEKQSDFCHRLVMLGREYCPARSPHCVCCPLRSLCPTAAAPEEEDIHA